MFFAEVQLRFSSQNAHAGISRFPKRKQNCQLHIANAACAVDLSERTSGLPPELPVQTLPPPPPNSQSVFPDVISKYPFLKNTAFNFELLDLY
jgi:hypothetical protein